MKVSAAAAIFSSPGEESALAEEMAQVGPRPRRMELSVHEDEAGAWAAASGFGTSPPSKRLQPGEREKERQKNERFCSLVKGENQKKVCVFLFSTVNLTSSIFRGKTRLQGRNQILQSSRVEVIYI